MEYLDQHHPEWLDMWEQLGNYGFNNGDQLCLFLGRTWEYMGSNADHHHFQHPCHPKTGQVEYVYLERYRAAMDWA